MIQNIPSKFNPFPVYKIPDPNISISTIPAISWDFENAATSSVNLAQYVKYSYGTSTVNYAIVETLPTGVQFSDGVLSADKTLMSSDFAGTLTLSAYASDAEPATQQFSFGVSDVISYLKFTGLSSNNAIVLNQIGSPSAITLQYSKNNESWTNYTIGDIIDLASGETVVFSGANDHFSKGFNDYYQFAMTGTIEAKGNIQSLMNFSDSCTNYCYNNLFRSCSSLTKAPYLSATTLAYRCYSTMFYGCSNLSSVTVAFTDWGNLAATINWLQDVAANGTFTCPTALGTNETITRGVGNCPTKWTVVNT